jgi:hypothetical protein
MSAMPPKAEVICICLRANESTPEEDLDRPEMFPHVVPALGRNDNYAACGTAPNRDTT